MAIGGPTAEDEAARYETSNAPYASEAASTFALELIAPVQGGRMLARLDGQVTFVAGGIPGEVVRAFVPTRRPGYLEAEARVLQQRSADRVMPPCAYFGENGHRRGSLETAPAGDDPACGGCQYQHIQYRRQVGVKGDIVADVLRRVGKIAEAPILPAIPAPKPYQYRNKASWLITPDGELAFREARSHTAVPVDTCPLLTPALQHILDTVRAATPELGLADIAVGLEARVLPNSAGSDRGTILIELAGTTSDEEAKALGAALLELCPAVNGVAGRRGLEARVVTLAGDPTLQALYLGEELTVSAASFFQVNTEAAQTMSEFALSQCGLIAGKEVLDVYSGVGAFTVPLARSTSAVIAVELDEQAVLDTRATVARLGLDNVTLLQGDAGQSLRSVLPGTIECVIVDPPRAGCAPNVLRQLVRIKPRRVVYVSCDPATLARDLRTLLDQGFTLEQVQPFDLFPQTAHIENVALLKLPKKYRARR